MQMTLMPDGRVLNLNPGETLLSALRRHDEPISYSCQDGRCGLCRCGFAYPDLISSVNALSPQLEALSDVLACQTVPTSDCLLELSDRTEVVVLPPQVQRAKVLAIESVADHVRRLRVRLGKPLIYLPGQSFELRFAPDLTRRYSAASLPDELDMSFHILIHPEGRASEHVAKFLKVGDTIRLQGPYGSAYLREHHSSPLLLVSSGTGLGAMLSLLRSLAARGATHAVHVYAGFGMAEEAYGREEFEAVTQAIKSLRRGAYVIGGGALRRGDRHGLITDIIEADLPDLADWRAYVFGSPHAVDSTTRLLRRKGIAPRRLHAEPFLYSGS